MATNSLALSLVLSAVHLKHFSVLTTKQQKEETADMPHILDYVEQKVDQEFLSSAHFVFSCQYEATSNHAHNSQPNITEKMYEL